MTTRLEKLQKQREQLDARIKQLAAREKTRERKMETRRKILLGAYLQQWMNEDEDTKNNVMKKLDGFLTRKYDRQIFGLEDPGGESVASDQAT